MARKDFMFGALLGLGAVSMEGCAPKKLTEETTLKQKLVYKSSASEGSHNPLSVQEVVEVEDFFAKFKNTHKTFQNSRGDTFKIKGFRFNHDKNGRIEFLVEQNLLARSPTGTGLDVKRTADWELLGSLTHADGSWVFFEGYDLVDAHAEPVASFSALKKITPQWLCQQAAKIFGVELANQS